MVGWKSLILFCLFSPAIGLSAPTILKERPRIQQAGLFFYLSSKCPAYLKTLENRSFLSNPVLSARCLATTGKFIKLLDMPIRDHVSRTVVFKKELVRILNDRNTETILRGILSNADLLHFNIENETIFAFIRRWLGSDANAMHFIATLFQDTSLSAYHLEYASQIPVQLRTDAFETNLELTGQIVERMLQNKKLALSFYPDEVRRLTSNPNIYHFFVIARLSHLLRQNQFASADSFLIPFLMNYAYEALAEPSQVLNKLRDDVAFKNKSNVDDVMLGYLGALWGVGRPSKYVQPAEFRKLMGDNSGRGSSLRELLQNTRF